MALPLREALGLLLQPLALTCEPLPLLFELSNELPDALRGGLDIQLALGQPSLQVGCRAGALLEVVVESSGMGCGFPQRRLEPLDLGGRLGKDALALAPEVAFEPPKSLDLGRQPFDLLLLRAVAGHTGMIGRRLPLRSAAQVALVLRIGGRAFIVVVRMPGDDAEPASDQPSTNNREDHPGGNDDRKKRDPMRHGGNTVARRPDDPG